MTLDMFEPSVDNNGTSFLIFDITKGGTKNWQGGWNAKEPVRVVSFHLLLLPWVLTLGLHTALILLTCHKLTVPCLVAAKAGAHLPKHLYTNTLFLLSLFQGRRIQEGSPNYLQQMVFAAFGPKNNQAFAIYQ